MRQGLQGKEMLRTQIPAQRGCWLAAHSESLDEIFGDRRLAKPSLPSVYLMKYYCLVALSQAGQ